MTGRKGIACDGLCGDLVRALERARSRFAVAVATESKTTPRERWRYYLETEGQMRRRLKELRSLERLGVPGDAHWTQTIEVLRRPPSPPDKRPRHSEAELLCQHLRGVLADLERLNTLTSEP